MREESPYQRLVPQTPLIQIYILQNYRGLDPNPILTCKETGVEVQKLKLTKDGDAPKGVVNIYIKQIDTDQSLQHKTYTD